MKKTAQWMMMIGMISGIALGQIAFDRAENYEGWGHGDNEGFGFGVWDINANTDGGFAGVELINPADAGISGMSATAFTLYADPGNIGNGVSADRSLSQAMNVGETFSFLWGANWASGNNDGGNRGFNLYSGGVFGTELINLNHGNSDVITINGTPMLEQYGTQAMSISITYTNPTTLTVAATGRDGVESFSDTVSITGAPDAFRIYASGLEDNNINRKPYFDEFTVIPEPGTALLLVGGLGLMAWMRRRNRA